MATFTTRQPNIPQNQSGFPTNTQQGGFVSEAQQQRYSPMAGNQYGNEPSQFDAASLPQYQGVIASSIPVKPREQSPFMQQFEQQIKILDPERRESFIETAMQGIQDRLARYNFAISRGRTLDANQQAEYDALLASLGDIQDYMYKLQAIPGAAGSMDFQHPSFVSNVGNNFVKPGVPVESSVQGGTPNLVAQAGRPGVFFDIDQNRLVRR